MILNKFPERITNRLILENDDKTFNVHHNKCNSCEEGIKSLLPKVFRTWEDKYKAKENVNKDFDIMIEAKKGYNS